MAESTPLNQTKDQSPDQDSMSLDQLDNAILSEDPSFAADLRKVQALPVDGSVNLDVMDLDENLLDEEPENPWRGSKGLRRVLLFVMPFMPWLWDITHSLRLKLRSVRVFLKGGVPNTIAALKAAAKATVAAIKEGQQSFSALPTKKKVVAVGLAVATAGTVALVYRSYTHGILPADKELFVANLEEWATQTYKYDPETEIDSFYDSPQTIQNIISLPKMVVNIHPSRSSGPNPMAAMEFFLEGLTPDVIIEVKDREVEVVDAAQRTMEDMTYDELDSAEGKHMLTERLRQDINSMLTKGKIRRVFVKEAVIKP